MSKVQFYVSPPLDYGEHWLKITNLENATHSSAFSIDYLINSIQAPSNASLTSATVSSTAIATPSASSGKTWTVSATVGGITAVAFVFLVVCGIAVYFIVMQHRWRSRGERLRGESCMTSAPVRVY